MAYTWNGEKMKKKFDGILDVSVDAKNLNGLPKEVDGDLYIFSNNHIKNLKGLPKKVTHILEINGCNNLTSLKGISEDVGVLYLKNLSIKKLDDFPKNVWRIEIDNCDIKNLKGFPDNFLETDDGDIFELTIRNCQYLESLEGMPEIFYGMIVIENCPNFKTFKGSPKKVVSYDLYGLPNLKNLEEISDITVGLSIVNCGVETLKGLHNVTELTDCKIDRNDNLSSFDDITYVFSELEVNDVKEISLNTLIKVGLMKTSFESDNRYLQKMVKIAEDYLPDMPFGDLRAFLFKKIDNTKDKNIPISWKYTDDEEILLKVIDEHLEKAGISEIPALKKMFFRK